MYETPEGDPPPALCNCPCHRAPSRHASFSWNGKRKQKNIRLFYEGELEFLQKSREELAFLIKLDEIRRLHRLVSDMYYEIISRSLPPDLGFRRRGTRPHTDPVNAMLSFGYAMLFGTCIAAVHRGPP